MWSCLGWLVGAGRGGCAGCRVEALADGPGASRGRARASDWVEVNALWGG